MRLAARISHVRKDFLHQTMTRICRENHAITIENLSVQGVTASSRGDNANPGTKVRQKADRVVQCKMSALVNLLVK